MTRRLVYLPPDAAARLHSYVYHGEDRSYIYAYMWTPLCRRVVQLLPRWLSPNVITVTALVCACVTHLLAAYYMPYVTTPALYDSAFANTTMTTTPMTTTTTTTTSPPAAVFVAAACVLFLYQLLDNLDGHQARRLGVASPLGLLLDHGCDAFNCIVGSLTAAAAIAAGPCWKTWCVVLSTMLVFLCNTWEEYYRGALIMPVINGPNEGLLLNIAAFLWTAWCGGPAWWHENTMAVPQAVQAVVLRVCTHLDRRDVRAVRYNTVAVLATTLTAALTCLFHVYQVYKALQQKQQQQQRQQQQQQDEEEEAQRRQEHVHKHRTRRAHHNDDNDSNSSSGSVHNGVVDDDDDDAIVAASSALPSTPPQQQPLSWTRQQRHGQRRRGRPLLTPLSLSLLHALTRLTPLLVLTAVATAWLAASPSNIFQRHPRLFCWTAGLLYTKMSVQMMVAHLCGLPLRACPRTFVPFLLIAAHVAVVCVHNRDVPHGPRHGRAQHGGVALSSVHEELLLYELFAVSAVTFAHLVWHLTRDTLHVLDVPLFHVRTREQQQQQQQQQEKHGQ